MGIIAEDALVKAVRSRGSDARDARDAAHEACHALEWNVLKKWTRDNIHARKPRVQRTAGVRSEILARAVEAIVCKRLGIAYDFDKWVMVCFMEMLKNERINLPADFLPKAIRLRMQSSEAQEMADRVLALALP